jgi:hypothetical protein
MADEPADTLATNIQFVGRGLRVEAFAGQNGDPSASSLLPGQQVRRGTVAKSLMKGTQVTLPVSNAQTRTVSAKPIKTTPGMRSRNAGSIAKAPAANKRADKAGVVRPTR